MKYYLAWLPFLWLCVWSSFVSAQSPLYELRVYQPTEGNQTALLRFMNDHGIELAKANGLDIVAAFVPSAPDDDRIVTLVRHKDRATCDECYERMMADPATRKAFQEMFPSGPPVRSLTRVFLRPTDYSPDFPLESQAGRVFELRTYIASAGNLDALNARFRNHTMTLFAKHGMNNIIYWNVDDQGSMKGTELLVAVSPRNQARADIPDDLSAEGNSLVYFLTHASQEAAKSSFDTFRQDPNWTNVKTESETKAGGSLTAGNGVKSWFLKPTDFSPLK